MDDDEGEDDDGLCDNVRRANFQNSLSPFLITHSVHFQSIENGLSEFWKFALLS